MRTHRRREWGPPRPGVWLGAAVLLVVLATLGGLSAGQTRFAEVDQANQPCLKCHDTLLNARTLNPEVKEAHRRHVESTVPDFGGRQRLCVTCHEGFIKGPVPALAGGPVKGYFHPTTSNQPLEYWRIRVRKLEAADPPPSTPLLTPEDPQIFKPTLRRMVCLDCHSHRLKTFYPTGAR